MRNSEEFRDIKNYEGRYQVSPSGGIKSLRRTVALSDGRIRTVPEKILKHNIDRYGYATVGLNTCGKVKWHKVHRLVALMFIGESSLTVNHIDMNKLNNYVGNLEYLPAIENCQKGRKLSPPSMPSKEEHPNFKVSREDRIDIIHRKTTGEKVYDIAKTYGIHPHSVYKIIKRKW